MPNSQTWKNRERSKYTFANINLLGKCNMDCYFCLGKDLDEEFAQHNQLQKPFLNWKNYPQFIQTCREKHIPQIYITGQNTDALCYKYLAVLIRRLQTLGFYTGIRTNGLLALQNMDTINTCTTCWGNAVSYSVHTLRPDTMEAMTGIRVIPDWDAIIRATTAKLRVSVVFSRYNKNEMEEVLTFLSKYPNIEYVQIRKISTDTRYEELKEDIDAFEEFVDHVNATYSKMHDFEKAHVYDMFGKPVSLWRTIGTSVNSINYFTNGVLSTEYFIIEGYAKEQNLELDTQDNK